MRSTVISMFVCSCVSVRHAAYLRNNKTTPDFRLFLCMLHTTVAVGPLLAALL